MEKPSLDRDSLFFSEARRLKTGIEVVAAFQALKVSNPDEGPKHYVVTLTIDPVTHVAHNGIWELGNRNYSGPKDRLRELEKVLRNEFIKRPAWEILSKLTPEPSYTIDELGKVVEPDPPINRRI
jgi:hypothetical protein